MNKGQCLGVGVLMGYLFNSGVDGSLFPSSSVEKKDVVKEEKEVPLKEDTKEVYLNLEQAGILYDSLRLHSDAFTQQDIAVLQSSFTVPEGKNLPETNLCHYDAFVGKEPLNRGTCFFLSPQLALTNYHVVSRKDPELYNEFYDVKQVVQSAGKKSTVHTMAVSPLYDLALIKTEKKFAVETVPLGFYLDELSTILLSYNEEGNAVEKYLSRPGALSFEKRFLLLENGILGPSALVIPRLYSPGDSGSPLFQEGRLVGLVSYVDDEEMKTFVTSHVRAFVSEILQGVKGEE